MATSSKRSKSSHYLPEELIFKILSWTKGTSLLRFKSVCKLWNSIISDNKFIESHHTNSLKNPSILMVTYNNMDKNKGPRKAATIVYFNSPKDSVDLRLPSSFHGMKFVNSCNGIVCVHNGNGDDVYLLNPLTKMSKRLPILHNHNQPPCSGWPAGFRYKRRVLFGFGCVSHDFKVLKITYEGPSYVFYELHEVYLYSSNANSWREIDKVNTTMPRMLDIKPVPVPGPVVDGVVYFRSEDEIVTFDLHNEIFGSIPYPNSIQLQGMNKFRVLDFEGSIAVVSESGESVDRKFSLWTMEELVSGKVFWNETLTFDASSKINLVDFCSGAKQFVGSTSSGREIFSYDYEKNETKYFELPSSQRITRVLNHTESFLPIKGFEKGEELESESTAVAQL